VWSTQVLTTLGFHYAFDVANPSLAVAAVMSVLPVLVPVVVVLLRKVEARTLQL
jgi:multiple sugar transport system permease protein